MQQVVLMSFLPQQKMNNFRAGFIALAGRPNVGKSTLLNQFMRQKVSITSKRRNTTRHRILGVLNEHQLQYVFVDMPGFNTKGKRLVDRTIQKTAVASIQGVDLAVLLVGPRGWHEYDVSVWKLISSNKIPTIIAINKIDWLGNRDLLLPVMKTIADETGVTDIVPISAKKGKNVDLLKAEIGKKLPQSPPLFSEDYVTDKSNYFQSGELIREQIFRSYGDELPYICAVEIEKFEEGDDLVELEALIWVETEGQKRIIIGKGGENLKRVGINVRKQIAKNFEKSAHVQLWVKVQSKWTESQRYIDQFGYSQVD